MSEDRPIYAEFLGSWTLLVESCRYQQGDPPSEASTRIEDSGGTLTFWMNWTDSTGERHEHSFAGVADGEHRPFDGGELADAMAVSAPTPRELTSSAYLRGEELMVAQRQLDESGNAMRITQLVRLPDGTELANQSVYRKVPQA